MLAVAISILAALVWGGFLYAAYRFSRSRNVCGQEKKLNDRVNAPPASDSTLEPLLLKFPKSPTLRRRYTANALQRQDWETALRRAAEFRAKCPREGDGWILGARALQGLKRDEEAETLLRTALRRLPRDLPLLLHMAGRAREREDWAEMARLMGLCRRHYPDRQEGYTQGAVALARAGRAGEARALLGQARTRFPTRLEPWTIEAEITEQAGAAEEALLVWTEIIGRFPLGWQGYTGKAGLLKRLGRTGEACELLRTAQSYFPENQPVAEALKRMEAAA